MASSTGTSHTTTDVALLHNGQDITGTAIATVLLADVENADALHFNEADTKAMLIKQDFKVCLCVEIMSNVLGPVISAFHTGAGPYLVRISHLTPEWCNQIKPS